MYKYFKQFILLMLSMMYVSNITTDNYKDEIKLWQKEMNAEFKDAETSPLTNEDRAVFKRLNFYPIDQDFSVKAKLTLNKKPTEFGMKTTTERRPIYIKYGVASFKIKGQDYQISIYQNIELVKRPGYTDHLFMLFTDKTSGKDSYAGGRYIDLKVPQEGELLIDFNKAYNPYCAYNHKYSCPIPPNEDYLDTEILAGVMKYDHK